MKVAILGAGVSGLALAYFLKKRHGNNLEITIVERSDRCGGWIKTRHQDGFLFELGARSCRASGAGLETLRLVEEIGLADQCIGASRTARYRYLWMDQQLQRLPTGLISLFTSPLTRGIVKALFSEWRSVRTENSDETVYDFFSRRFSPEIAERFMDPLCSGIYAGDIHKLSIRSCFPMLFNWEQKHGSVLRGLFKGGRKGKKGNALTPFVRKVKRTGLFSFKGGMETLVHRLVDVVDADLKLGTTVRGLTFSSEGARIDTDQGTIDVDHVYSTLPAAALSRIIFPVECLNDLHSTSLAIVNLGFREQVHADRGFGYLVPSKEQENILGVVWDSQVFPAQQSDPVNTVFTVMLGGEHRPDLPSLEEKALLEIALEGLEKHLGVRTEPALAVTNVIHAAIPQYLVGHEENIQALTMHLQNFAPTLTVLGNSFFGVATNDCIATAYRTSLQEWP